MVRRRIQAEIDKLEGLLAGVSAMNVTGVLVEVREVREAEPSLRSRCDNPEPFAPALSIPHYIVVRHRLAG